MAVSREQIREYYSNVSMKEHGEMATSTCACGPDYDNVEFKKGFIEALDEIGIEVSQERGYPLQRSSVDSYAAYEHARPEEHLPEIIRTAHNAEKACIYEPVRIRLLRSSYCARAKSNTA